jgi:hypothetical protein
LLSSCNGVNEQNSTPNSLAHNCWRRGSPKKNPKSQRHGNRHGYYNRECMIPPGRRDGFGHPILSAAVSHQCIPRPSGLHTFELRFAAAYVHDAGESHRFFDPNLPRLCASPLALRICRPGRGRGIAACCHLPWAHRGAGKLLM